jgi:hypothetical protein
LIIAQLNGVKKRIEGRARASFADRRNGPSIICQALSLRGKALSGLFLLEVMLERVQVYISGVIVARS